MRAVLARRRQIEAPISATAPVAHDESCASVISRLPTVPGTEKEEFDEQKMLHLTSWPELRTVPPDCLIDCARICALLSQIPSVGFLVHRRLALPRDKILPVLQALHARGHLRIVGGDTPAANPAGACEPGEPNGTPTRRPSVWEKLFAKLLD
jgi:hypothetical protein